VTDARDPRAFLRTLGPFAALADNDLAPLAAGMTELKLKSGQILMHEGDVGGQMYFLRHGSLAIAKRVRDGLEQVVARVAPGEFVGEMALFDYRPRSASIRAEADSELFVLDRAAVNALIAANPSAAAAFLRVLSDEFIARLRRSNELIAEVTCAVLEASGFRVEDWRG
jgi:CRP/FNR family cyclic AMP-dependent transcriptional regulator